MEPCSSGVEGSCRQGLPCAYKDSPPALWSRQTEREETLVQREQQWEGGFLGGRGTPCPSDSIHPPHSLPFPDLPPSFPNTAIQLALANGLVQISPNMASIILLQCLCPPSAPCSIPTTLLPLNTPSKSSMPPPLPVLIPQNL